MTLDRQLVKILASWLWSVGIGALFAWAVHLWFGPEVAFVVIGAWCGSLQWAGQRQRELIGVFDRLLPR